MNPYATTFTRTSFCFHRKAIKALIDAGAIMNPKIPDGWAHNQVIYNPKESGVPAEPLPVEKDHVFSGFDQVCTSESVTQPIRLHDGRLVPDFYPAIEFTPAFLKQKSTGQRRKNRNHAKPSTK